jgi:hypothetical protein
MAYTILKNTPIHTVVAVSGDSLTETIALVDLATSGQTPSSPKLNIRAIQWSVPGTTPATITRNSAVLWKLTGVYDLQMNGYNDNRQNGSSIVVTTPSTGGTVIIEFMKISGWGDVQHLNQNL